MARLSWKLVVGLVLVGLSLLLGLMHYLVFGNTKDLFFNLALNVVFVPVQVLLVTLIIERLLSERERQALLKKLNMVIGAFMSEVGAGLLRQVDAFCGEAPDLARSLLVTESWKEREYRAATRFAEQYQRHLTPDTNQLAELRSYLLLKRPFVLSLLQNPNLLEHDCFTDLLWAVCHLTEELEARSTFTDLQNADYHHLCGDIKRANSLLIREWLSYMRHLQGEYPYMFSLAVRLNPFNPQASPIVYG